MMKPTLTVYKASAGSGKTFTLAVEYIILLITHNNDSEFAHTLAVTFTNKATGEMKDRILEQLYGLSHYLDSSQDYLSSIQEKLKERNICISDEEVRARAGSALHQILHDYSHFRVETIDSFFQSVLRDLARELGLSAKLEVELNNEEVISRAVDRIVENLQIEPQIQKWIISYVDQQLDDGRRWDIRGSVKNFARCIFEERFQNRPDEDRKRLDDEELIKQFTANMRKIQTDSQARIEEEGKALQTMIDASTLNFERISRGGTYSNFISKCINREMKDLGATISKAIADPLTLLNAKDKKSGILDAEANQISAALKAFWDNYQKNIYAFNSAKLAINHINPMRLLGEIEKRVNEINEENNQFNLSKTPTLLSSLVEQSDAPFVFEKTGTQFRNIMIDEFQDTSTLQWKNFRVLLLENQAQGGQDLLVGDIKQSIYRWRNGDWSILNNIQQDMKHMQPDVKPLDTNFRSLRNVIEFNNTFFVNAANAIDACNEGSRFQLAQIYSDVVQQPGKKEQTGYAYVHLYKSKNKEYTDLMLQDMIDQIRDLTAKGLSLSDIAILVRYKKAGTELIERFHEMAPDIKLVSDEAFLLRSSLAIQMIINAIRVLADPKDDNPVPKRFLAQHYQTDILKKNLTPDDLNLNKSDSMIPSAFLDQKDELKLLPLYLLCERLYTIFQLDQIQGQEAYLFTFYDQLQNYLRDQPSDIHSFLTEWDDSLASTSIPGSQVDGIRIQTIHASKGLEYHTVLVPYTDWRIEHTGDVLWCDTTEDPYNQIGILPIDKGKDMSNSIFSEDSQEEHLQSLVDALNMIYVAFTRAGSNLFVWGSASDKANSIQTGGDIVRAGLQLNFESDKDDLIYYTENAQPVTTKKTKEKKNDNRLNPQRESIQVQMHTQQPKLEFKQSNDSEQFIRGLSSEVPEEAQQSYIEIGKILHYALSQIITVDDVELVLKHCETQGYIKDQETRQRVLDRINNSFKNKQIRDWFSKDIKVFNECSIAAIDQDSGEPVVKRPDRVIMNDHEITVIDFKYRKPCQEYYDQVQTYMRLMKEMYPSHQVSGYLWFLYSGKVYPVTENTNPEKPLN